MSPVMVASVLGLSTGFLFAPIAVTGGVSALSSGTGLGVDWLAGGVNAVDEKFSCDCMRGFGCFEIGFCTAGLIGAMTAF